MSRLVSNALLLVTCIFASQTLDAQETTLQPVVREASPAAVRVTGYMHSADAEYEYDKYGESSGFFFDEKGLLFTVYSPYVELKTKRLCEKFEVELFDGRVLNARALAVDPVLDLAILKMTEEDKYPVLDISSPPGLSAGAEVWAIAGRKSDKEISGFSGRLKAKNKTSIYGSGFGDLLIDTYMELPEHAYGGPLLNQDGKVLGINIFYTHQDTSPEEAGEEHAIPISVVTTIYRVLLANPTFEQKWLGFSTRRLTMKERASIEQLLQRRGGVYIDFVWKEGPAGKADIRSGDILVGLNGDRVMTTTHFEGLVFKTDDKTLAELAIVRNGMVLKKQVNVEKRPPWAAP